ncbi:SpaH/EbpB family LPXTG-anchored major pilin [Arcanobacterium bovis]|uniref:Isopeptide-forming domain-containing fimbrial protein n=1 Tax=Arcanobacterium bovis TaxID=2529275 RepID=A0A4Q9V163_9ACTO|nr:SpaH/EbpB family LPXTG-anchored major pilin [Arcanobacterium bovis]TBW21507.1 isopeptide-forming domain-containing fimbrial protein [Arcanobacterium bovis]
MKSIKLKVVAVIALVATFAVGGVHSASAADTIDPSKPVSLTINKYEGDPTPTAPNAVPVAPTNGAKPLDGAQFKIEAVNGIDLSTQAGWSNAALLTDADKGNDPTVTYTDVTTLTTSAGTATISTSTNTAFKVGMYRVTELQKAGYTIAPPFYVTLPYSDPATGAWTYNLNVYPKNQNVTPTKTVNDSVATVGKNLTYTIKAPVPAGTLDRFNVVDTLVSELALQSSPAAQVTVVGASALTLDPGDYSVTYDNNILKVVFSTSGLQKLQNARVGDPTLAVQVVFEAKVLSVPSADATVKNTASIELPNAGSVQTGQTATVLANVNITKSSTSSGVTADQLNGATFEVYRCSDPDADGKFTLDGSALVISNVATTTATDPQTTNATLVTAGGTADNATKSSITGYGLPYSSAGSDGAVVVNKFCVLETKAPAGFVRNPEVLPLTNWDPATHTYSIDVNNVKDSLLGQLPATGAFGIVIIFLIGIALLGRGFYTSRRDNEKAATA